MARIISMKDAVNEALDQEMTRDPTDIMMGEDIVDDSVRHLDIDTALQNAGSVHERYFRVPSILGDEEGDR